MPCVDLLLKSMNREMMTPTMVIAAPPLLARARDEPFLESGADVSAKDPQGRTMLMLAAASDDMRVDVVKNLLARGHGR